MMGEPPVSLEAGHTEDDEPRAPKRGDARRATRLGRGGYHTREGGGTGRAWVRCHCDACAHISAHRLQDGERAQRRAPKWKRVPDAPSHWRVPA